MRALIYATFSAFFLLQMLLWWERYNDNLLTLKDDSLSLNACCTVQPSQCHYISRSNVTFSPFQSPPSSLCAFLSLQGGQHRLPFGDNVHLRKLSYGFTVPTD